MTHQGDGLHREAEGVWGMSDTSLVARLHASKRRTFLRGYGGYVPEVRPGIIGVIAFAVRACNRDGITRAGEVAAMLIEKHGVPTDAEMAIALDFADGKSGPPDLYQRFCDAAANGEVGND